MLLKYLFFRLLFVAAAMSAVMTLIIIAVNWWGWRWTQALGFFTFTAAVLLLCYGLTLPLNSLLGRIKWASSPEVVLRTARSLKSWFF